MYHAAVGLPDGDSVDERVTDRVTVTEAATLFDGVMLGEMLKDAATELVTLNDAATDADSVEDTVSDGVSL